MANSQSVYILGGAQSDFARNWTREGKHFSAVMSETVNDAMERARIEPREIQTAHVGNFAAELYAKQGQLGAFFLEVDPHSRASRPPVTRPPAPRDRSRFSRRRPISKPAVTTWLPWSDSSR